MNQELEELYLKSVKQLKALLKDNKDLTSQEWNEHANKNKLLSAITIMARDEIATWESLRDKYKIVKEKRKRNIFLEIKKVRRKLDENILKNGLQDKQTRLYSDEIDILINEYYKSRQTRKYPVCTNMTTYYEKSYKELKRVTKEFNEFPTIKLWNKYALENNCLSSTAMQYISRLDWHKLRTKIKAEINAKI